MLRLSGFSPLAWNLKESRIGARRGFAVDARIDRAWNIFSAPRVPAPALQRYARLRQLNALSLAQDLHAAEPLLKRLIVAPLMGEYRGERMRSLSVNEFARVIPCKELLKLPAVQRFAVEVFTGGEEVLDKIAFTNANVQRYLYLRQRLEDVLIEMGLCERAYHVRPSYQLGIRELESVRHFSAGDRLELAFPGTRRALHMTVCGEADTTLLNGVPVVKVAVDSDDWLTLWWGSCPPVLYLAHLDPQRAAESVMVREALNSGGAATLGVRSKGPEPFFSLIWQNPSAVTAPLNQLVIGGATISIFPEDPAELVIHKILVKREGQLADNLAKTDRYRGTEIVDRKIMRIQVPDGETVWELIRTDSPLTLMESGLLRARYVKRDLSFQDWMARLEGYNEHSMAH